MPRNGGRSAFDRKGVLMAIFQHITLWMLIQWPWSCLFFHFSLLRNLCRGCPGGLFILVRYWLLEVHNVNKGFSTNLRLTWHCCPFRWRTNPCHHAMRLCPPLQILWAYIYKHAWMPFSQPCYYHHYLQTCIGVFRSGFVSLLLSLSLDLWGDPEAAPVNI